MKLMTLCSIALLCLVGCNSESTTLRDEAVKAQEDLADARDQAAEIIADSEEEAVDIVADARQDAKDTVRNASEEADDLVQDAKQDLDAAMNRLGENDVKVEVKRTIPVEIQDENKP